MAPFVNPIEQLVYGIDRARRAVIPLGNEALVVATEEEWTLVLLAPGATEDKLMVNRVDDMVQVQASVTSFQNGSVGSALIEGAWSVESPLGVGKKEANFDAISATLEAGVLTVVVPFKERKRTTIPVSVTGSETGDTNQTKADEEQVRNDTTIWDAAAKASQSTERRPRREASQGSENAAEVPELHKSEADALEEQGEPEKRDEAPSDLGTFVHDGATTESQKNASEVGTHDEGEEDSKSSDSAMDEH